MPTERIHTIHQQGEPTPLPWVDVVMAHTRGDHAWCAAACASVHAQSYPNCRLIRVDNNDRALTIGAAWNLAVKQSTAKYLLFLGDDDLIARDLVHSLVMHAETFQGGPPVEPDHITSYCLVLDEQSGKVQAANVQHTGMFTRTYLERNPFNEVLASGVGVDAVRRMQSAAHSRLIGHSYGYVWRWHIGMVSGAYLKQRAHATA